VTLVDVNVLLYAVNRDGPHHDVAKRWLDGALSGSEIIGFSWTTVLAFLRLATRPSLFRQPLTATQAIDVVNGWLGTPNAVTVEPTPGHMAVLSSLLQESGAAGNLVNDAHLAAVAIEHRATVTSFDADFGRFSDLNWTRPG
jgi:toxin-antitoxin system PIN domain toxin